MLNFFLRGGLGTPAASERASRLASRLASPGLALRRYCQCIDNTILTKYSSLISTFLRSLSIPSSSSRLSVETFCVSRSYRVWVNVLRATLDTTTMDRNGRPNSAKGCLRTAERSACGLDDRDPNGGMVVIVWDEEQWQVVAIIECLFIIVPSTFCFRNTKLSICHPTIINLSIVHTTTIHMPLFRRKEVECFFCLSPQSAPAAARAASAFRCEACQCWNVRDKRGTIVSDLPAMHNSALNNDNFALRGNSTAGVLLTIGKPSSSRLPSTASSPFCRDCITNQTLVMNLLGNYLPDESVRSFFGLTENRIHRIRHCRPICRDTLHLCTNGTRPYARNASQQWTRFSSAQTKRRRLRRGEGHYAAGGIWSCRSRRLGHSRLGCGERGASCGCWTQLRAGV